MIDGSTLVHSTPAREPIPVVIINSNALPISGTVTVPTPLPIDGGNPTPVNTNPSNIVPTDIDIVAQTLGPVATDPANTIPTDVNIVSGGVSSKWYGWEPAGIVVNTNVKQSVDQNFAGTDAMFTNLQFFIRWTPGAGSPGDFDFVFYGMASVFGGLYEALHAPINTSQLISKNVSNRDKPTLDSVAALLGAGSHVQSGHFQRLGIDIFNLTGTWDAGNWATIQIHITGLADDAAVRFN